MTKQICTILQRWPESQRLCLVIDNAEGVVSSAENVLVRLYSFSLFCGWCNTFVGCMHTNKDFLALMQSPVLWQCLDAVPSALNVPFAVPSDLTVA